MLKHILHPVRTAGIVGARIRNHREAARLAAQSRRYFHSDARFNPANIAIAGNPDPADDTQLLERICNAWAASVRSTPSHYRATPWWEQYRRPLRPVLHALETKDLSA